MKRISHISHGMGEHVTGHGGNCIATNGAPKKITAIAVHDGMRKTGNFHDGAALGGDHSSALDSLSGATVPARGSMATPGWGNGSLRSGGPIVANRLDGQKRLTKVQAAFGARNPGVDLHELGRAVLDQAALGLRGKTFK